MQALPAIREGKRQGGGRRGWGEERERVREREKVRKRRGGKGVREPEDVGTAGDLSAVHLLRSSVERSACSHLQVSASVRTYA